MRKDEEKKNEAMSWCLCQTRQDLNPLSELVASCTLGVSWAKPIALCIAGNTL